LLVDWFSRTAMPMARYKVLAQASDTHDNPIMFVIQIDTDPIGDVF
jgi:hypothetical protein